MIASTIDTLNNIINGYEIACIWNSNYNVHVCMIQTNADFIFQKRIVFDSRWLYIVKIKLNNYCRLQCSRIDICQSCFVYDLSNTIFCPIAYTLTAQKRAYPREKKWFKISCWNAHPHIMSFITRNNSGFRGVALTRITGLAEWLTDLIADGSKTFYPPQLVAWDINKEYVN